MREPGLYRPEIKETQPLRGKIAVITGNSRGIGAEISRSLAMVGVDIVGNHVDPSPGKMRRQERLEEELSAFGITSVSVLADITEPEGRQALLQEAIQPDDTGTATRGVDYLILNAAGGLEEGKPEGWAEKINIEAQLTLVDDFLPHMNPGGKIIYLTSLWAHRYGEVKQLPSYEPVARTKNAAERLLRERIPQLHEREVSLGILSGHVIKGTAAYTLFRRAYAERLAQIEQTAEGGVFPEAADMGNAVRDMLLSNFESGYTRHVGGTEAEPLESVETQTLNRDQVAQKLPMYGDNKLLVDEFDTQDGVGRYTVREEDCDGHFANDFEEIKLFRGVDQIEAAAQTLGLAYMSLETDTKAVPLFRAIDAARFQGMIFPGDKISMQAKITSQTASGVRGDVEVKIGDTVVMTVTGIDLGLAPNNEFAKRLINRQKSSRQKQG